MRRLVLAFLLVSAICGPASGRQLALDRMARVGTTPPMTALAVASDGSVLAGAPNGVYRSIDTGLSWTSYDDGLGGLGRIVRAATADASGTEWLGTEGGVYRRGAYEDAWIASGLQNRRVNALVSDGRLLYAGTDSGIGRSLDGGLTWSEHLVPSEAPGVIAVVARGSMVLAGTRDGMFRSQDAGSSWTPADPDVERLNVAVLFRASTGTVFVGVRGESDDCVLYRSRSDGRLWSCIAPRTAALRVEAIAEAPDGRLFVAGGRWIAETADEGHTWTLREAGSTMVRTIAAVGETLLAGTAGTGIMRSSVDGAGFEPSNDGIEEGWARVATLALDAMVLPPLPVAQLR